jgi:nicotinamidase-related amidase
MALTFDRAAPTPGPLHAEASRDEAPRSAIGKFAPLRRPELEYEGAGGAPNLLTCHSTNRPEFSSSISRPPPGKGAFYATELGDVLQKYGIENLLVCGVTTEVCVNTTVREASDRGYRCVVLADRCVSYFPEFHEMGLKMIKAQGGIFGWVSDSAAVLKAMTAETSKSAAGASR